MPFPIAAALAAAPAMASLFQGGPKIPSYDPGQIQQMIQQFMKMLTGGPIGQGMFQNAALGANQFASGVNANLAQSGLSDTRMGGIAGAGAQSMGAMSRVNVLSELAKMAQGMTSNAMEGQYRSGMAQYNSPHGLSALLGQIGTSAYPLIMGQQNKMPNRDSGGGSYRYQDPNQPWLGGS